MYDTMTVIKGNTTNIWQRFGLHWIISLAIFSAPLA